MFRLSTSTWPMAAPPPAVVIHPGPGGRSPGLVQACSAPARCRHDQQRRPRASGQAQDDRPWPGRVADRPGRPGVEPSQAGKPVQSGLPGRVELTQELGAPLLFGVLADGARPRSGGRRGSAGSPGSTAWAHRTRPEPFHPLPAGRRGRGGSRPGSRRRPRRRHGPGSRGRPRRPATSGRRAPRRTRRVDGARPVGPGRPRVRTSRRSDSSGSTVSGSPAVSLTGDKSEGSAPWVLMAVSVRPGRSASCSES